MISLFLENENDRVTNKIAFVQTLAGCKKQKVLKSVLGEEISTKFDKLCLFVLKQYQTAPMQQRTLIWKYSGSVSICGKSTQ